MNHLKTDSIGGNGNSGNPRMCLQEPLVQVPVYARSKKADILLRNRGIQHEIRGLDLFKAQTSKSL